MTPNTLDYVVAFLGIIMVLEASRRAVGPLLPLLALFFLFYAYFGRMFPGIFQHSGFTFQRIISRLFLTEEGVLGLVLTISSTFIILFIIFGEFLKKSGVGQFFSDFARAIAGQRRGGPAKMAVIMSAMMGTISGASVANAATTGAFTIGLMKRSGYTPRFAAAVEATASTGGMFMPPIMGAAAFMISGFLGIPYIQVAMGSIIPTFLFYLSLYLIIDSESVRLGLLGLKQSEFDLKQVILRRGHLIAPVLIIVYLLIRGYTPTYAAVIGIVSTVLISMVKIDTRMSIKSIIEALEDAPVRALPIGMATAVIGIIVGVTNMTALGVNLSYSIMALSMGIAFLGLFFMMIASIIVSMGLPATAVYAIVAIIAAPAVIRLGIEPLPAHFFVFWFGCISGITPPVALCSYTAAGIAGAKPNETAISAIKIALPGFIIPFLFTFRPELMFVKYSIEILIPSFIFAISATVALGIASFGYIGIYKINALSRILLVVSSIVMVKPSFLNYIGLGIIVVAITYDLIV